MKITAKLWIGLAVLTVLSPLGLILPAYFKAGAVWGEWGAGEVRQLAGYIPLGLERLSNLWNAPMPDYAFKGWEEKGLPRLSVAYILSAVLGILSVAGVTMILGKALAGKNR